MRVLLVDHDEAVRALVTRVFEHAGHHVTALASAAGVLPHLNAVTAKSPDVIVLEDALPQQQGVQLLGIIAVHPRLKATPVLVYSSAAGVAGEPVTRTQPNLETVPKGHRAQDLLRRAEALFLARYGVAAGSGDWDAPPSIKPGLAWLRGPLMQAPNGLDQFMVGGVLLELGTWLRLKGVLGLVGEAQGAFVFVADHAMNGDPLSEHLGVAAMVPRPPPLDVDS